MNRLNSLSNISLELCSLVTSLPCKNSYKSVSELNRILNKYLRILDYVNSYNETYKSATTIYYPDVTLIRDEFERLSYSASQQEKDRAFECVRNELKTDLEALAILVQPKEALVS